jgi:hypothetical protein
MNPRDCDKNKPFGLEIVAIVLTAAVRRHAINYCPWKKITGQECQLIPIN